MLVLPQVVRFRASFGPLVEGVGLRHPSFVIRRTSFTGMVVDERVLWGAFPLAPQARRPICYAVYGGRGEMLVGGERVEIAPGDVFAVSEQGAVLPCWTDVRMIELAWTGVLPSAASPVVRRAHVDPTMLEGAVRELDDPWSADHAALLGRVWSRLCELDMPLPPLRLTEEDAPTPHELALSRAMQSQFENLSDAPMAIDFAEELGVSERQLLRIHMAFNDKYRIDARSWRDQRNRWRVKIAAALLSVPDVTIERVAHEVGYRSSHALSRAFVQFGLPAPSALRRTYGYDA